MVCVSSQNRKLWLWQRRHANAKTKAKTNTQASAKTKAKSGMKKPSALCDMTLPDLFRAQKEAEVARRKPKRISKGALLMSNYISNGDELIPSTKFSGRGERGRRGA